MLNNTNVLYLISFPESIYITSMTSRYVLNTTNIFVYVFA